MSKKVGNKVKKAVSNPRISVEHLVRMARPLLVGVEMAVLSRWPIGTNILDENWDLLIVLDTCRVDALREITQSENYDWLSATSITSKRAIGGSTLEWTAQTFCESNRDLVNDIDFVAGNMIVEDVLAGNQNPEDSPGASWSPTAWSTLPTESFNEFISAWKHRDSKDPAAGHDDRPHPSARIVTDRAIEHGRNSDPDRLIVHYIQPHYPYYKAAEEAGQDELKGWQRFPFPHLRNKDISREQVWETYIAELRSVVGDVDILLDNYDADRVVVTGDHGEAFGEWGGYKHRAGTVHPKVRRVPWLETTATDLASYQPEIETDETEMEREEMLRALGYMD